MSEHTQFWLILAASLSFSIGWGVGFKQGVRWAFVHCERLVFQSLRRVCRLSKPAADHD